MRKRDVVRAPTEVELAVRRHPVTDEKFIFALNFSGKSVIVQLQRKTIDLLSGNSLEGDFELEPYGVLVLGRPRILSNDTRLDGMSPAGVSIQVKRFYLFSKAHTFSFLRCRLK
ncbi:Beta-galactosidase C-terminal domain [Cohnella suwonensis]|uniref:Beta-galactosidase C-terminal domain n=1 Tax=Cohnella suwonensis TaxID=696072 RepID=A0ABW0M3Y8_9BACL